MSGVGIRVNVKKFDHVTGESTTLLAVPIEVTPTGPRSPRRRDWPGGEGPASWTLADKVFADQWRNHTLQPTAIVHEAYMRLVKGQDGGWENKRHFLSVAALAMRQLLTDYARGRNSKKREGSHQRVLLDEAPEPATDGDAIGDEAGIDLAVLDEALTALAKVSERQARIVELRFLTGLTVDETADVLGVSKRSVYLDWNMARSWLQRRLSEA